MSRFDGGWIKVHRKLEGHWITADGYSFSIFMLLLIWANYKQSKKRQGKEILTIERGELLTSTYKIAARLGFERKTVERVLIVLEKDGAIKKKVSHRGTHITICNYDKYQGIDEITCPTEGTTDGASPTPSKGATATPDKRLLSEELKNIRIKEGKKERTEEGNESVKPPRVPKVTNPLNQETWKGYREAYLSVYRTEPIRNAKINSQISQLVQRLGHEAPAVAGYYLTHRGKFYVQKMHTLGLLLADAEKIHTEWKLGRQMTEGIARQADQSNTIDQVFDTYIAQRKERMANG